MSLKCHALQFLNYKFLSVPFTSAQKRPSKPRGSGSQKPSKQEAPSELTNGASHNEDDSSTNGDSEPPAKRPKTNGVAEDKSRDYTSPEPRAKAEIKKEVSFTL